MNMKRRSAEPSPAPNKKTKRFDVGFLTAEFVKQIENTTEVNEKFKLTRQNTTFLFDQIDQFADPAGELKKLFQNCVDKAVHNSLSFTPDSLGCIISSSRLNNDIEIPIRDLTANTVDGILNQFYRVQQSKSEEGSLFGAPFTVKITTVARKSLPKQRKIIGAGRIRGIKHNVDQNSLFIINNTDSYCLLYACELVRIHVMKREKMNDRVMSPQEFYNFKNNIKKQRSNVLRILNEAKIPKNLPEYSAEDHLPSLQAYYDRKFGPNLVKIFIFNDYGLYKPIYTSTNSNFFVYPICIYLKNQHFNGIRTISGFFKRRYYCLHCQTPYSHKFAHRTKCVARCNCCSGVGVGYPCEPTNYKKECTLCSKTFLNEKCYSSHLRNGFCRRSKLCRQCGVIWNVEKNSRNGRSGHVCTEQFCFLCKRFHDLEKGCYIQKFALKKPDPYRMVVFDFETEQSEKCQTTGGVQRFRHNVNFVSANITCTKCMESGDWCNELNKSCKICGKYRTRTWAPFIYHNTTVGKAVKTSTPLRKFVSWLLHGLDTRFKTICMSHNGGRFDMTMIFKEFFASGITPDLIRQGNRLYEMKIKKTSENSELVFHDSYNLVPRPLADLVGAFNLKIETKAWFPHLYNRPENYNTVLPTLPDKEFYLSGSMKPEKKDEFERWYMENYEHPFALNEKLSEYCCNDTKILTHALIALRDTFFELTKGSGDCTVNSGDDDDDDDRQTNQNSTKSPVTALQFENLKGSNSCCSGSRSSRKDDSETDSSVSELMDQGPQEGIDIIHNAMTIASACMKNYRLNHLRENRIAIVPEKGYDRMENQSLLALKFLQWYEEKYNVEIQTALSSEGERRVGNYQLDGFIRRRDRRRDLGLEVNGCFYHGCKKCFPNDQTPLAQGKTAAFIRQRDAQRLQFLRRFIDVEVFWECDIREQLKTDAEMKRKFENYIDNGPIQLRDAYFGGRTGPAKLYHKVQPGYKISYKDFTSLYPFTNYSTEYPVGHPKPVVIKTTEQDKNWTRPEQNTWKGILKVLIQPPQKVDVAVLPTRFDDRLLFPLCKKCSLQYPEGGRLEHYSCPHSDNERAFVSTCTHIELNEAIAQGYIVKKLFRVLQYSEWDDSLFKSYVSDLMAIKLQASGFPEGISEEQENEFIEECFQKFGIKIDRSKMASNPSIRTLSKLMLNSLWGRFSLRNTLSKTVTTDCPAKLRELLDDPRLEVTSLDSLTDDVLLISYGVKLEFIEEHDCSNIVMSLWTTSAARLILLRALQSVSRTPNCQILYCDTDSIIYVHPIDNDPLPTGAHLGELTDEYPLHSILEFASAGCKNYALKLHNNVTGLIEYLVKVRGITLDYNACKKLHYDTFVEKVMAYVENDDTRSEPIILNYPHFLRPDLRTGNVFTTSMNKIYRPIVTKGVVGPDFMVRNYGEVRD